MVYNIAIGHGELQIRQIDRERGRDKKCHPSIHSNSIHHPAPIHNLATLKSTEIMNNTITKDWDYAHWTFRTGTRTFQGVEIILENAIENLQKLTSHPCGTLSSTNDLIFRNAFSKISLTMSYALLEGFFIEEHDFYKKTNPPKKLIDTINGLLKAHNISLSDWKRRSQKIEMVRKLRNAEMHNNGVIRTNIDSKKCEELFGENVFQQSSSYPQLSLDAAISLIREFQAIADEYAEAVFKAAQ